MASRDAGPHLDLDCCKLHGHVFSRLAIHKDLFFIRYLPIYCVNVPIFELRDPTILLRHTRVFEL